MGPWDKTTAAQNDAIAFEFDLTHPPQKVWRALTEPELLKQWLLPTVGFDLKPGTDFVLQAGPQPGWDGKVNCRLLGAQEQKSLSYTWVVGAMNTTVTFTLTPTATGTRLNLEHTGFSSAPKQNFGGARYGWNLMGGKLVELLDRAA